MSNKYIPTKWVANETIGTANVMNNIEQGIVGVYDTFNSYSYNVVSEGVVEGVDADVISNTTIIQNLINNNDDLVLYFPSGIYKIGKLDFGNEKNITFIGKSSSFATSVNKSVSNPKINDTYSRIVVNLNNGENWITHSNCTIIFDKLSFVNGEIDSKTNTITPHNTNLMIKTNTNLTKGKVFATECSFIGWKVVSGDLDVLSKEDGVLQSCWLANRCRFTHNTIALSQLVDARIIDCSFNKNNYAIVMKKSSGFSTFANNRIEWNIINGIVVKNAHDVILNANEFDRNGRAGLYVDGLVGGTIDCNVFRRNGAVDELEREDYENNAHFVIKNCENVVVGKSITVAKGILDTSDGGKIRPTNCSLITGNTGCIFTNNILNGCSKSDKANANKIENNSNCIVDNNLIGL